MLTSDGPRRGNRHGTRGGRLAEAVQRRRAARRCRSFPRFPPPSAKQQRAPTLGAADFGGRDVDARLGRSDVRAALPRGGRRTGCFRRVDATAAHGTGHFCFALNASYGFGQKPLSGIVGSGTPRGRAIEATFWLHNSGVALLAFSHSDWTAFIGPFGVAVLAAAAFSYALGMRGFVRVRRTSSRPEVGQTVLRR